MYATRRFFCSPLSKQVPPDLTILNVHDHPVDIVYPHLRAGKHVLVKDSLEVAATYQHYLAELVQREFPAVDVPSLVHQQKVAAELNERLLIDRDFESYKDFINKVLNTTCSVHLQFFEETHWNNSIAKEMLKYTEKVYPVISFQYLSVSSYLQLVEAFAASRNGVSYPLLLGSQRLRPMFGVTVPKAVHLQHIRLFLTWFRTMRRPLMLDRVLCLSAGLGVLPLALTQFGLHGISCTDANPRAVESLIEILEKYRNGECRDRILCQNAALFPPPTSKKFDCIVYAPDILKLSSYEAHETPFAPGLTGIDGEMETFFENAAAHMRDWGIAVVVTTNFRTLLEPERPHAVEFEIKHNRRWVVLDYYEAPMRDLEGAFEAEQTPKFVKKVRDSLKAEIWVLHTIKSIGQFGFVHGIPNADAPDAVKSSWAAKRLKHYQRRVIRECAAQIGTTVQNIKGRLASVMHDADTAAERDAEAEYIQMKLDPERFARQLMAKQEKLTEARDEKWRLYEEEVDANYAKVSPRQAFDERWRDIHRALDAEAEGESAEGEYVDAERQQAGMDLGTEQSL